MFREFLLFAPLTTFLLTQHQTQIPPESQRGRSFSSVCSSQPQSLLLLSRDSTWWKMQEVLVLKLTGAARGFWKGLRWWWGLDENVPLTVHGLRAAWPWPCTHVWSAAPSAVEAYNYFVFHGPVRRGLCVLKVEPTGLCSASTHIFCLQWSARRPLISLISCCWFKRIWALKKNKNNVLRRMMDDGKENILKAVFGPK